jgi:hypothetical protein
MLIARAPFGWGAATPPAAPSGHPYADEQFHDDIHPQANRDGFAVLTLGRGDPLDS